MSTRTSIYYDEKLDIHVYKDMNDNDRNIRHISVPIENAKISIELGEVIITVEPPKAERVLGGVCLHIWSYGGQGIDKYRQCTKCGKKEHRP